MGIKVRLKKVKPTTNSPHVSSSIILLKQLDFNSNKSFKISKSTQKFCENIGGHNVNGIPSCPLVSGEQIKHFPSYATRPD